MKEFNYKQIGKSQWDSEILGLVAQIHEYKGRQEIFLKQKPAQLNRLVEIARVQSTEASNKIEGIITTNTRLKQLCMDKTSPRNRDEEEIMGYREVLNAIHENFEYIPLKSQYILQLHRDLYQYSEKSIGGRFKNTQNYIIETGLDGKQLIRFTPLAPYETPGAIDSICDNFNSIIDSCEIDPLVLIPIFINDFLCIHPFNDGNGRMSRLLNTLLLYKSGYFVGKYISLESKIERTKSKYYSVLEQSCIGWYESENNPAPLIKYILGTVLSAYRDFESRVELTGKKTNSIDIVRRAVNGKIGKFTKNEIMETCPSVGKASVENALKLLIAEGVIEKYGRGRATFYVKKN